MNMKYGYYIKVGIGGKLWDFCKNLVEIIGNCGETWGNL